MPKIRIWRGAAVSLALGLGLVIGLAMFALPAQAAPIEIIMVDAANAPFMFESDGAAAGIYPALIAEIFHRLGEPVDLEPVPWLRAQALVEIGAAGIGGLYKTKERVAKYDFSDALFDEQLNVYVRAGAGFDFAGIDSLIGKRIGVLRGWSYGQEFDDAVHAGRLQVEATVTDLQNIDKLRAARLDALIATRQSADLTLAALHLPDLIVPLDKPLLVSTAYIAFNKRAGKLALIGRINAELVAMRADGSYARIVAAAGK